MPPSAPARRICDFAGALWCKTRLGSQTSADSYLTSVYGSYPQRPWLADMIGRGLPHAILTFLWRDTSDAGPQTWQGRPDVKFVCKGIRLYDPRKDTTAGGSGAHRFDTASTHEWTENPVVMIYNILRGIPLAGGFTYGGGFAATDLPFATWAAAMNICDQPVGSRKRYIAGYEVRIGTPDLGGDSPLDVIDELLKACSGQIADVGGTLLIRVGGPGLPVRFLTDADILRSSAQELDPFPALEQSHNGIHATHPRPSELWQPKEAPPRYDAAAEARDGQRLIADLQLPAVPQPAQVQQLMAAWLRDDQRHRRHRIVLPPEGILIEPLSVIDWTSPRNGYSGKAFEVGEVGIDPQTLSTTLALREVDPSDHDWSTGDEITIPAPSVIPVKPGPQSLPDWTVTGVTITDASGTPRLPGIRLGWSAPLPGVSAIRWQVRVAATGAVVASGTTQNVDEASHIVSAGILRNLTFEARGRPVGPRETAWTPWEMATAPDVTVTAADLAAGEVHDLLKAAGLAPVEIVSSLPSAGNFAGRTVYLATDGKLYRFHDGTWTAAVPAADLIGEISGEQIANEAVTTAKFAQGLTPVEIVTALPAAGNFAGRTVHLTTDGKLYRHAGSPAGAAGFTAAVPAADLTGQIAATQIADAAITTPKLAAGAVTAASIAANAITAGKIAAGAVSTAELAAGAIVASRIALTDLTNLVLNNDLDDRDGWIVNVEIEGPVDAPADMVKARAFRIPDTLPAARYAQWDTGVDAGEEYAMACEARGSGSAPIRFTVRFGVQWWNAAGALISSPFSNRATLTNTTPTLLTWTVTAPANAVRGRFLFGRPAAGDEAGHGFIGSPMVRRRVGASLIVDGAITASELAANAVNSVHINAGAIVAGKMAANSITAANAAIANAAVDTLQIAGQAVIAPVRAINMDEVTITASGRPWETVLSLSFTKEPYWLEIFFTAHSRVQPVQFRVVWGGGAIRTFNQSDGLVSGISIHQNTGGPSAQTYALQARAMNGTAGNPIISNRYMSLLHFKR